MEIFILPDGRRIVARLHELYRADEQCCPLPNRRRLGVHRLAQVIEDQLGVPNEDAWLLASALVGPQASGVG